MIAEQTIAVGRVIFVAYPDSKGNLIIGIFGDNGPELSRTLISNGLFMSRDLWESMVAHARSPK